MEYLLKASGIVLLLFLFYIVFLKNETFFKSIRSFFIAGLLIVLTIPLIEIPIYVEAVASQLNLLDYNEIVSSNSFEQSIDWTQIILLIYLIGVAFFSIKFLVQLISLGNLVSKHQLTKQGSYYFVETSKTISPFSFFNIIIYNKSQFTIDELEHIINHEKAHAQQWHSIDTILAHLLVITLWFNPFVWLYKKAVQQNLEFLADAYALELANNHKMYQFTLLKSCNATYSTALTNNFYNSLIKKRILMLHKNRSQNKSQWKYALLLPVLIAFVLTFNTKVIAQEKKLIEIEEVNNVKVDLVIDKNSTDEHLKKEANLFKKEFDITLSFKGIKRNAANEITAIKIDAKGKGLKAKFENAGSNPINPIKLSYNSDNNSLNISNLSKLHKNHYTYRVHESGDVEFKGKPDKDGNYVFISSEGKEKKWKQKGDKSENIFVKKIVIEGDKDNYWIHKKGKNNHVKVEVTETKEGEHEVKIIEEILEVRAEGKHEIEIIKEKGDKNVFIIKTDGDKMKKHKMTKKGDFMFISDDGEEPLIFIDGKESTNNDLKNLEPNSISEMSVLKGKVAIEKYGEKAKDGVILITTKKN
jgi:bla regulator protein blaR1